MKLFFQNKELSLLVISNTGQLYERKEDED
jgi:hypothetical protein